MQTCVDALADARGRQQSRAAVVADGLPVTAERGGESDGLNLLPTPAVNDMGAGKTPPQWDEWTARMKADHGNGNGHGKSLEIEAQRLLPTPAASDGPNGGRGEADALPGVVTLLPTPKAQAAKHAGGDTDRGAGTPDDANLWIVAQRGLLGTPTASSSATGRSDGPTYDPDSGKAHTPAELAHDIADGTLTDFGPYSAAIARWETVIGRPAPSPTEPGKDDRPRLSPRFVEWMMGLPDGWVTGADIPRSAQLKALGNGVVPAQAALALALLDGAR